MNSKQKMIAGAILFLLFLIGSARIYQTLRSSYTPPDTGSSASSTEDEKVPAPDFTVTDNDGNAVKLSDFKGTPVVLNFWASWCPPCKAELPDFENVYAELDGKVAFFMINATDGVRETKETAADYIAEQGYQFPVFYDLGLQATSLYGISSFPTTVLIDSDGYTAGGYIGMIDEETLRNGIDTITAPQP